MKRPKLPTEIELWHEDIAFRVRFDYDRGEEQWFDARAGVGSPGHDPCVEITEVNFGAGWEDPGNYPQLDIEQAEDELLQRLCDIEAEEYAAQAEAEYNEWREEGAAK